MLNSNMTHGHPSVSLYPNIYLHLQVRDKLCALTPNRPDLTAEIADTLDTDRLQQMLGHGAFDSNTVTGLIR